MTLIESWVALFVAGISAGILLGTLRTIAAAR